MNENQEAARAEGGDDLVCPDECQDVHILGHPALPPMSYTRHAAGCSVGSHEQKEGSDE